MEAYNKYFNLAYKKALYLINNTYVAEDIASEVLYLLVLKEDSIKEDISKWVIGRVKNHCKRFFASQKREKKIQEKFQTKKIYENEILKTANSEENEKVNFFYQSYLKTLKQFTEEEKSLINVFLQNNMDISKTAKILERSYSDVQKKIFRLKGIIRAQGYLNFGYLTTKKIIAPSLNDAIFRFLKKLIKAIKNNSYNSLANYFADVDIMNINFDFQIKRILDYDVQIRNGLYRVTVIFVNNREKSKSILFNFKLTHANHLKIIGKPEKKAVYKFSANSKEAQQIKQLLRQYKENKQGFKNIPDEVFEKYIEKYKQKHKDEKINED